METKNTARPETENLIIITDGPYPTAWYIERYCNSDVSKGFWGRVGDNPNTGDEKVIANVFSRSGKRAITRIERQTPSPSGTSYRTIWEGRAVYCKKSGTWVFSS